MSSATSSLNSTVVGNTSALLQGACGWTSERDICYGTIVPIFVLLSLLVLVLVYQLWITPQQSALQAVILAKESPLLPQSFRFFEAPELNQIISAVSEMPLKTFLPRVGLSELVEPCATLGIANVKDLLRANRLALRDIGIGPRETRLFARALERRVRLREKMQEVFLSSADSSRRYRTSTLTQRSREAAARSAMRVRKANTAASEGTAAVTVGVGAPSATAASPATGAITNLSITALGSSFASPGRPLESALSVRRTSRVAVPTGDEAEPQPASAFPPAVPQQELEAASTES